MKILNMAKNPDAIPVPSLTKLQTNSYQNFIQYDIPMEKRKNIGLEAIIKEMFPVESYDGKYSVDYLGYDLGEPRYIPDECKELKLTYGVSFKIRLRLNKKHPVEEDVYLGDIPLMLGGGEFIINGAERVIVSQLHRSPGIDFVEERVGDLKLHSAWIVPERGSWIELNVSKKNIMFIKIDQSSKVPVTTFLRAISEKYSSTYDIIKQYYDVKTIKLKSTTTPSSIRNLWLANDVVPPKSTTVVAKAGTQISNSEIAKTILESGVKSLYVIEKVHDPIILNTIAEDPSNSHQEAALKVYSKLRPGNPPNFERAKQLIQDRFFDEARYKLGRVGRFRINRKLNLDIKEDVQILQVEDIVATINYIIKMRKGLGYADDIDHLGNRRVRTIAELAGDEVRKGFLRLRRYMVEKLSSADDVEALTPRNLVNSKTVSSSIEYFFGRGELSQVVDQTNPLAQLTHERRLSALGPGGLNRKRAGFEVRDVHISHYGRICPIETPEGANIGLITSTAIYTDIDDYGFLITPYRKISNGKVTEQIVYLRAYEEAEKIIAPADIPLDKKGKIESDYLLARHKGDFIRVSSSDVDLMDVSTKQIIGISAALIPFLENDDANRALMGSNMQRQAVPLLTTEPPIVGTGMEKYAALNSSMVLCAEEDGVVTNVSADAVSINEKTYFLKKFRALNEKTCLNQRPIVNVGDKVKKGDIIADGAATCNGELSLGKNVLVAFMIWGGYNFEDAIIVSEGLIKNDSYTSLHVEEFEAVLRETKLGREEFTRDISNVPEKSLSHLDEEGVIQIGTHVKSGDILVGKVAPKSKSELTPEEKLLHAIFGKAGEDVKNESLLVPSGVEGVVIDTRRFRRKSPSTAKERQVAKSEIKRVERWFRREINNIIDYYYEELKVSFGKRYIPEKIRMGSREKAKELKDLKEHFSLKNFKIDYRAKNKLLGILQSFFKRCNVIENEKERKISRITRGDDLPTGVLEMVKVYVCTKRTLSAGDKMAGRHGNKGVISKILPEEDMPFLKDGTPVDIVLNPLGVPSRMNIGQILETHLGLVAKELDYRIITPPFSGCKEDDIDVLKKQTNLPEEDKVTLYDGRTGEPFDQKITIGYAYMMKLNHLVDDKIHARATGPYSLITQQPLGGKARYGGQRFGEMEVWALEAYGAAYLLQEVLTVKSDDVDGRTKIYESMIKGENVLDPSTPMSFEVLVSEIKGLCLNIKLEN